MPDRSVKKVSQQLGRRLRKREGERNALTVTLVVSLLAHMALVPPLLVLFDHLRQDAPKNRGVELVAISQSSWSKNKKINENKYLQKKEEEKDKPESKTPQDLEDDEDPQGQIVALPPPTENLRPDQADYLSEHDRSVEHESRSRHQTAIFLNPTNRPQSGEDKKHDVPSASQKANPPLVVRSEKPGGATGDGRSIRNLGPDLEGDGGGRRAQEVAIPRVEQQDRLQLKLDSDRGAVGSRHAREEILGNSNHLALLLGPQKDIDQKGDTDRDGPAARSGGDGSKRPGFGALMPDTRTLERLAGAPANDNLPDVEEDEATFLNTWRFRHAPFFNRIADSIRRQWNPGPAIARRDPSGNIYGYQDRFTLLQITITRDGAITEIAVAESCGVDFLDREAVMAFRRAEPFANPPARMFRGEDKYTFNFGFNVDFQTSPLIQFNWRAAP